MVCILCRFPVEPDDAVVWSASGPCICLRCYARETGTTLSVPKALRHQLEAELDGLARQSKWGID